MVAKGHLGNPKLYVLYTWIWINISVIGITQRQHQRLQRQ